jgi:hypothetical protein
MQAGIPNLIVWQLVTPGGCALERFSDGTADGATWDAARVCLGHVDDPHDGLLAEMDGGRERVPWVSASVKAEAIERVRTSAWMPAEQRSAVLAYIRATPHFAD